MDTINHSMAKNIAKTVLSADFGTVNTRVCLFDFQDGKYRFMGAASALTVNDTQQLEYNGFATAVKKIEKSLNRTFLDRNDHLIMPARSDFSGVDQLLTTYSNLPNPRIVLLGLSHERSMESLRKMLRTIGIQPAAEICAADGQPLTYSLDILSKTAPQIVLIGGGLEQGAEKGLYHLGELLMLFCRSLPKERRPMILFVGNSAAKKQYERVFSRITDLSFAGNVLCNDLDPSQSAFAGLITCLQEYAVRQSPTLTHLATSTKSKPTPGELVFARTLRLISQLSGKDQSVLALDVGASRTMAACGKNYDLDFCTLPYGVGSGMISVANDIPVSEIRSSLDFDIKDTEIRDYLINKYLYPTVIPSVRYAALVEQSVTRAILRRIALDTRFANKIKTGALNLVLLNGAVFRNVEDPGDALLMAMDGLRVKGAVNYHLDMNGLNQVIGNATAGNPLLASQITNASAFLNLGKVITPVFSVKEGDKVFSVAIRDDSGKARKYDIPAGGIFRIPLEYDRYYEMDWFDFARGTELLGVSLWTPIRFKCGCFGVVFDMRNAKRHENQTDFAAYNKCCREQLGSWQKGFER